MNFTFPLAFLFLAWTSSSIGCDELFKEIDAVTEIKTTTGKIKGKIEEVDNREVIAFLGIPFAKPPTDDNRFKKPVPITPWKDVLDATKKPRACMQVAKKDFDWIAKGKQDEDCLYLNVWVPKKYCTSVYFNTTSYQLPIMVWIHGGGFWAGSSNIETYDGAVLASHTNVVVASMNYRLGAFGFFYSGTSDAPGNMGLHDQQLALKWIKDNAQSFCGDPHKITLFGESAGSMAVGLHLVSPLSQDLFKRAIMESGSPNHPILSLDNNFMIQKNNQFATALQCANEETNLITDPETVISCLRSMNASTIVEAESVGLKDLPFSFLPIQDDDILPKSSMEAIKDKDIKRREILIGNNEDEGAIFLHYSRPDIFTHEHAPKLTIDQGRSMINFMFQQNPIPTPKEIADFYLGNLTDENPKEILKAVHSSFGDFVTACPPVFFAEHLSTENDIYFYLFTYKPINTVWGDWIAVGHYEEVPFVFGVPVRNKSYANEECKFSHNIMQMWANFARHGRPLPEEEWPTYDNGEVYKELNPKFHKTVKTLRAKSCDFWRKYLT